MARLTSKALLGRFLILGLISLLLFTSAYAQVTSLDNTTSPPVPGVGHDYIKMLGETVNPANGSVSLRVDIPTPKGRGLDVPFSILYNSIGVEHVMGVTNGGGYWATDTGQQAGSGWTYSVPTLTTVQGIASQYTPGPPPATYSCYYYYSYIMRDWTGAAHQLGAMTAAQNPNDGSTGCNQSTNHIGSNLTGSDGVFQGVTTVPTSPPIPNPVTVADPDGTVYQFAPSSNILNTGSVVSFWATASSVEDRNGNIVHVSFSNTTNGISGSVTDTLGRTLVSVSPPNSNANTLSVSGQSGLFTQNWLSVPLNFSVTSTPTGSVPCTGIGVSAAQGSNYVVQTLTLPNGKSYQFQYDSTYGLLNKITYPTGGYVSYTWGLNRQSESVQLPAPPNFSVSSCDTIYDTPAITGRSVSYDGVHIAEQQSFSYQTTWNGPNYGWDTKQTTVTTYDSVRNSSYKTIYKYQPNYGVPVEQSVTYQDFSGAPLKTVTKAWLDTLLLGCEIDALDTGAVSGTWYSYGYGDQITDKKEYDYGLIGSATACQGNNIGTVSPAPSGVTPTRETITAYKTFLSTLIFPSSASIFDRPSTIQVLGKGTLTAETDYGYDEISVSGVSANQHDDTNYNTSYNNRGNVTTKTAKCLQTGCSNAVTTYKHDETGQVTSMTDPCGNGTCSDMAGTTHTTTYFYANSFTLLSAGQNVSYSPSGSTNAYLTQLTDPLGHISTFTYDYSNGQLTTSKDQNDIAASRAGTTYVYNDVFSRPTQVNSPDGGQTQYAYNDSPPSPTVTTCQLINGTAGAVCSATTPPPGWKTSVALMDGIGHVEQTQLAADPDGATFTETNYDGLGRVYTQSNPHRSGGSSTDGTTTYFYDALGRTVEVARPDGSDVETSYSGNCTQVTDEAGAVRRTCSDALGRLIEVDEPGSGGQTETEGSGTVTIGTTNGDQSIFTPATHSQGNYYISGNPPPSLCGNGAQGTITISVSGALVGSAPYYTNSTQSSVGSALISSINSNSNSPVTATGSNNILLTSKATGSSTNYAVSAQPPSPTGQCKSMAIYGPASLTGGSDAQTVYDSGGVSLTVNGVLSIANYGQYDSTATIASSLAAAVNGNSSSSVRASAAGGILTLTAQDAGLDSNYPLSAWSSWNTRLFSQPSFTISAPSALGGGRDSSLGTGQLVTLYTYDALNNLTCAVQKGGDTTAFTTCSAAPATWRPRSFVYDSLSRLTSASNPESGTITYAYDLNSNLSTKTAPKPSQTSTATVTTNYSYDALDRLLKKTYTNIFTPTAQYAYDGTILAGCDITVPTITSPTNLIGRRSSMCSGNSSSSWSYDVIGRPLVESRRNYGSTAAYTKNISYQYYLDGSLKLLTYPSGNAVTYGIGGAGRALSATDSSNSYVKSAIYAPHGALVSMTNGSGIVTSNLYNDRLQPILLSAGVTGQSPIFSLCYDFHLHAAINSSPCTFNSYQTGDNGNVFQIINNVDSSRSTTFIYDSLNRLSQANTITTTGANCWGETYTIDAWGNLTNRGGVSGMGSCWTEGLNAAPASPKNQLNGILYDAAGNVTNGSGNLPAYDGENRIVVDAGVSYHYDADGLRIEKSSGPMYWPDAAGENLTETDLTGTINEEYIYFNGQRIARVDQPSGTVHYYFSDHLGSAGVITDASGNVQQQNYYYPYGGLQSSIGSDANHYKFTGKERDTESGLDEFGARYYASPLGRFMTPDWAAKPTAVPYAHYGNPQSLNLYSYVNNNPTTTADPDGHCPWCPVVEEFFESPAGEAVENWGAQALAGAGTLIGTAATALGGGRPPAGYVPGGSLTNESGASIFQMSQSGNSSNQAPVPISQPGTATPTPEPDKGGGKSGEVYVTEPQESGKPYVGRTTQGVDQRMDTRTDGRTGKATSVDNYKSTEEGQYKEQKAMDQRGGVQNLDNKRREVNPKRMEELKKKYEKP